MIYHVRGAELPSFCFATTLWAHRAQRASGRTGRTGHTGHKKYSKVDRSTIPAALQVVAAPALETAEDQR